MSVRTVGSMLSVGKLAAGQQEYYLQSVAAGVEDYYLGGGEAEGRWIGHAADKLDLSGKVTREHLAAVLDGRDPVTGKSLSGSARRKLPGWDLTFSAPKSVSLLYALAPAPIRQLVVDAHEQAVEAAFGYLQREAGFARRGHNGVLLEPGAGLIGAAFRHRTSRAGDPQLHTHVLLPNLVATQDGQWRSVHSRAFYRHARAAGALYRAALRESLTRQLGVSWRARPHGLYEIAGIPQPVLRAFSRRRTEIEEALQTKGMTSPKAADVATLATRTAKTHPGDDAGLHERWQQQADELGFGRDELAAMLDQTLDRNLYTAGQGLDEVSRHRLQQQLLGPAGLTAQVSVFRRRDVIRALCDLLPAGAPPDVIEAFADGILADREVIRLPGQAAELSRFDERVVFTTRELLTLEKRIVQVATTGRGTSRGYVPSVGLQLAVADNDGLSGEQRHMVWRLSRSGDAVELVVGVPGSGKTRALAAAHAAWRHARLPVLGCSVKASAAGELEAGAGIRSYTVARLLLDLDRVDPVTGKAFGLPTGTVLVVDEAGMLGTRQLARILDHTQRAHGKLVLVGDPKQLPAIDAAGLFPLLADRLGAVTLTGNRRQHDPADRDALHAYRNQDIAAALANYASRGRLHSLPTVAAQRDAIVTAWSTDHSQGAESLMIAYRRADIRALNDAARAGMVAAGEVTGPALVYADEELGQRTFQAGDRVLLRRNHDRLGIRNGDTGRVSTVDPQSGSITVLVNGGPRVQLPGSYVASGLDHAYAVTLHASQGLTITRTHVLGNDALFYEAGLVALSRHRETCHLYITDDLDLDHELDRERGHAVERHRDIAAALQRSRADESALDHYYLDGR